MAFVTTIDQAIKALSDEVNKLKKKADENIPSLMLIEKLTFTPSSDQSLFYSSGHYYGGTRLKSKEDIYKARDEEIERINKEWERLTALHEKNMIAIENNKLIHEKIKLIFSSLGVRDTYTTYEFKSQRSLQKKEVKHTAGYLQDLARCIPITDGFEFLKSTVDNAKRSVAERAQKFWYEQDKVEREAAAKEQETAKIKWMAKMQVKYDLPEEASVYRIKEAILSKDKYLKLAYYMECARGDFSCGGDVEGALDEFDSLSTNVEGSVDKAICDSVREAVEAYDDCLDGRCFRDCEYNYTALYSLVTDQALLDDIEKAKLYCDSY